MKSERICLNKQGKQVCKRCNTLISYSEKFDTFYCAECNIWLEEKCVDPLCEACATRPIRPIRKTKPKIKTTKIKVGPIEWK